VPASPNLLSWVLPGVKALPSFKNLSTMDGILT
jgi:hypothetical protein